MGAVIPLCGWRPHVREMGVWVERFSYSRPSGGTGGTLRHTVSTTPRQRRLARSPFQVSHAHPDLSALGERTRRPALLPEAVILVADSFATAAVEPCDGGGGAGGRLELSRPRLSS
jgi:hypothetical protein